jgi:hypothetical protein
MSLKIHNHRSLVIRVSMILAAFVLTTIGLRADDVVTHWNKVMLATIAAGGSDPITSTRTAAIVQASVFDSINGIERKYTPIHAEFRQPNGASTSAAVIESAYVALVALYPDQEPDLSAARDASLAKLHATAGAIR